MREAANRFTQPFSADTDYDVHFEQLLPENDFPFPWTAFRFFNAFPSTFLQTPIPLKPFSNKLSEKWDLVVLAYQPWFLTPAPAMATFLQTETAKQLLSGTPVITLIACRNMWLGAQEKVKRHLKTAGAELVGNIALVDHAPNVVSLFTILRWLLWGKKEASGLLPAAGVSEHDLQQAVLFGNSCKQHWESNRFSTMQTSLNQAGAVEIKPELVLMEKRGQRAFGIWSKFIGGAPDGSFSRAVRVYVFMFLLPTAVLILSPLLMLISFLLLNLKKEALQKEVEYYLQNTLRS